MPKIFQFNSQFILPEDFKGDYKAALKLMVKHICKNDNETNKLNVPTWIANEECFPWIIENGGTCFATYTIEDSRYSDLFDILDEAEEE